VIQNINISGYFLKNSQNFSVIMNVAIFLVRVKSASQKERIGFSRMTQLLGSDKGKVFGEGD